MIQNIAINKISPHPDNPRKDLGDLTELAASIKAQGVLQNLTVVPYIGEVTGEPIDGIFRVVIGHRRLAAAKLAGLTEVPCAISNMKPHEQVSTMLLENIQRSDLTLYEQAQGIQMLINFGDSVATISERTGFSESTVRRRVKLLELDDAKFRKSVERGATLADYVELEKIEDIELRNSVLAEIGTQNFKWSLSRALDEEKTRARKAELISWMDEWAVRLDKVEDRDKLKYLQNFYNFKRGDFEKPADAENVQYFYTVGNYQIDLYRVKLASDQDAAPPVDERYEKYREQGKRLEEMDAQAHKLRFDFVSNYTGAKKHTKDISDFLLRGLIMSGYRLEFDEEDFLKLLGIEMTEEPEDAEDWEEPAIMDLIADEFSAHPERIMLAAAYCVSGDNAREGYHKQNYQERRHEHADNDTLDFVYESLEKLGYELSDEEKALRDGTHELFTRKDDD